MYAWVHTHTYTHREDLPQPPTVFLEFQEHYRPMESEKGTERWIHRPKTQHRQRGDRLENKGWVSPTQHLGVPEPETQKLGMTVHN